ncbi:AAA family ATPase [Hyphococcus flavus]|uniref:AAA family ATPase n=1 Tax=Hyphococcus flavus TaxID=1866326 RepID=A0AAE9ZCR1_9PROT|nr:AAA family ATPase [Hyphococcus flavus]WDI32101.1 AAA family ATPase [Hyphococcus flavus]
MYEQFFGLSEKPFSIQPDPSFLYWGRTHRLAYAMLEYGVLNHAGISVVTGEVGCGKTTLIHRLLDQLSDSHTVALLSNVQAGRGDLLSWVLMSFGQPFDDSSHVGLFAQLQNFFIGEYSKGKRIVLIIDEAQNLSIDMLEELRLLSNINAGKDQLLQLILVGQPQLKDVLNKPELLQLTQRVGSDFHLTPLSRDEVQAYIETRLSIAGCRRRVFTERALDLIAAQSRGVPRVINVIADTALVYAFSAEDLVVGVETIRNVIRDKKAYGVFGIASDDASAPPIPSASKQGPDAFVEEDEAPKKRVVTERERTPEPRATEFERVRETAVKTKADIEPQIKPAAAVAPPPVQHSAPTTATAVKTEAAPRNAPEPVRKETPSAVTGAVIVSADPKVSPEATIRSIADGRAVVFAPLVAMPDAAAAANKAGATIVENAGKGLQTGGRARNAGYRQLKKIAPHLKYVQFLDAGVVLDPDWIPAGEKFLERRPEVAVIEGAVRDHHGRRREFTTVQEQKQNEAPGEIAMTSTGAALVRASAFEAAGGFRGDLIARDMEDLCIRQRRRGAHIWRIEEEMSVEETRRPTIGRWWRRSRQRGFDNAYAMSLHGGPPERHGVGATVQAVVWGCVFPLTVAAGAGLAALVVPMFSPMTLPGMAAGGVAAVGLAVYLLQYFASIFRRGLFKPASWRRGFYAVFGRFPEFFGAMRYWLGGERP